MKTSTLFGRRSGLAIEPSGSILARTKIYFVTMLIFNTVLILSSWTYLSMIIVGGYVDDAIFLNRGVVTTGKVVEQYKKYRPRSARYDTYIDYTFTVPDRPPISGNSMIVNQEAQDLGPGAAVPLIYDPQNPLRSGLNENNGVYRQRAMNGALGIESVLSGGCAILFAIMLKSLLSGYRRAKNRIAATAAA